MWTIDLRDEERLDRAVVAQIIGNGAMKHDEREIFKSAQAVFETNKEQPGLFDDEPKKVMRLQPSAALHKCIEDGYDHVQSLPREKMTQHQKDVLESIKKACPDPRDKVVARQPQQKRQEPQVDEETKNVIMNAN